MTQDFPIKIMLVSGARPNFVKVAPVFRALTARQGACRPILVHTGQHYDDEMSKVFFDELGLDPPHHYLGVGAGSHAEQTAKVMVGVEKALSVDKPDWVVVVGDVNSTFAAAITAVKLGVKTAHVEAGLRSYDRSMPEEINRILTDAVCDLLLTPSEDADENLHREGIEARRIIRVGNVMIDSLLTYLDQARSLRAWERQGLKEKHYILTTLHRPSNVDNQENFERIIDRLLDVSADIPVFFPLHPRTASKLGAAPEDRFRRGGLHLSAPVSYLNFISLLYGARLVLTDSGGVQEESTVLGIPCLTLRENTERPITASLGTNVVIGKDPNSIVPNIRKQLTNSFGKPCAIPMWDGRAGERIADALLGFH
jgi:UDP-N-acetylglucosamine 2-epimerase (non-hydrolysing)